MYSNTHDTSMIDAEKKLMDAVRLNARTLCRAALSKNVPDISNPSGIIAFDTETTGLNPETDEILELSIIDGDGNILFHSYLHPYWTTDWTQAESVHNISPDRIFRHDDVPYPHQIVGTVSSIFRSAKKIITYNGCFDFSFIRGWGIDGYDVKNFDVMRHFAPIYGEWNAMKNDFKWQKLTTCAEYYGYKFTAHDSLADARATLFCYQQMTGSILGKINVPYMRAKYPVGSKVFLVKMVFDPHPIPSGSVGTVLMVDDIGTVHCRFSDRTMGLIPGEDIFHLV